MYKSEMTNNAQIKNTAEITGVEITQLKESLKRIAEFFVNAFKAFKKIWDKLTDFVEQIDFDEIYSQQKEKRELYKLNFKRPRIQHQVLDRKPRHLIKKIIR